MEKLKALTPGTVAVDWGAQGVTRLVLEADVMVFTVAHGAEHVVRYRLPLPEAGVAAMSAAGPAVVDRNGVVWFYRWSPGSSRMRPGRPCWVKAAGSEDGRLLDPKTNEPVEVAT